MRGAIEHPLVRAIMKYQADLAGGDIASTRAIFAPDVVYTVPGNNGLSGRYDGPDAVMGYFARLMDLTGGSYRISDMLWLVNDKSILLETRNHATIRDRTLDWDEAILFTFEKGHKKRIDLFQADQAAVDAFFGGIAP